MAISLGSAYGEIHISTEPAERSVKSLADNMRNVGTKMSLAITAPLTAIAGAGLKATGAFEQSMNQLQVISGATESAMASLQAQALKLGADTSFSAGEAAEGMLELAKAGLSAEQTLAAIGGVLDLAAAGGLSVAQAAEIGANALNAFKLPAEDAGRVANLLAAAANASSIEVTDMAQSFQASASVFAANKQSIEDLSTAIALLGNNGIKGSDAGTSLKTMMMRLAAPTKEAAAALAGLNVEIYNADGSMRSFEDIVKDLTAASSGLSDAQRNAAFNTIFGADAIRAANILVSEGAASWDAMEAAVTEAGAAQKVAEARMQGLNGAVENFRGAVESALIAAFLPLLDTMSELIRRGADLVSKFAELPAPVRNAAMAFAAVMAAAGPLLVAIPAIGAALGALLSPIGLIVIAVAGLAAAWTADFGGIRTKTLEAWTAIQPALEALGNWVAARIPDALKTLQAVWHTVWGAVQATWQRLVALFEPTVQRIIDAFPKMIQSFEPVGGKLQALWGVARPVFEKWMQIVQALATVYVNVGAVAIRAFGEVVAAVMPHVGTVVGAVIDAMILAFRAVDTALTVLMKAFRTHWPAIRTAVTTAWGVIHGIFTTMKTWLESTLQTAVNAFKSFLDGLTLPNPFKLLSDTIAGIEDLITKAQTAISGFKSWISGISIPNPFAGIQVPSLPGWAQNLLPGGNAMGTQFWRGGLTWVGEWGPELVDLPYGSRVYDAQESQRMAGETMTIENHYHLSNDLDVESVARRVMHYIERRSR